MFKNILITLLLLAASASAAQRPNILIIFTDDQGYCDLACYGSQTKLTPRMDKLASESTIFSPVKPVKRYRRIIRISMPLINISGLYTIKNWQRKPALDV